MSALQGIDLETISEPGVCSRGSRYVPTTITKQAVVLRFSEGRALSINTDRIRQFGLTPPALHGDTAVPSSG